MNQHFTVTGMSCGHCERAITQAIHALDPQAQVHIDRNAQQVQVQSDLARQALAQAITSEGYALA
jgi:copper chaperone